MTSRTPPTSTSAPASSSALASSSAQASSSAPAQASKENTRCGDIELQTIRRGQRAAMETIEPLFAHQCTIHGTVPLTWRSENSFDIFEPEEKIKLIVGTAPTIKTFVIHKDILTRHSEYFKIALKEGYENHFIEARKGEFLFPEDDPEEFHRWVKWLYTCASCRLWDVYDPRHVCKTDDELEMHPLSWCAPDVEPEQAFAFGDRIMCPEYCMFALASFIQHVHLMHPDRILWAYENTPETSTLHRFVHAWIGWMKFRLDKKEISADERRVVRAFREVFATLEGWTSLDPRKYIMEHWESPCSLELYSACHHKTLAYRSRQQTVHGRAAQKKSRAQKMRKMLWNSSICIWYCCCIIMLVLSVYIYARDREGLILYSSKVLGIVTACFAFAGMCGCGDTMRWALVPTVMMALAAGIFSSHQAASCFKLATTGTSMCKIQAGCASVELLYTFVLTGVICLW